MSISLRKATIRLAYAVPALRQHLVPLLKSARQTTEPIRLKYTNLGDFGGTDPVIDSWVLEVAGPYEAMQALLPTLKKYKFQWNPSSRAWSIHASLYEYNNAKRQNFWNAARRNQEAAYPILKKLVDDYNRGAAAGNADLTGGNLTVKELQQKLVCQRVLMLVLVAARLLVPRAMLLPAAPRHLAVWCRCGGCGRRC